MKVKSKTNLRKKADELWRKIIHLKNYCEVCGISSYLNAHHIISRSNYNLRWEVRNGCLLCPAHHKFGNPSAHGNPIWFISWIKKYRPEDYEYLRDYKFQKMKTWHVSDYEEIIKNLEDVLNEIQNS